MYRCEADVAVGLEEFARAELVRRFGDAVRLDETPAVPGAIGFEYVGDLLALLDLRIALAVSLVQGFAVPRPRALLGDQHLRLLLNGVAAVGALHPPVAFSTLRLDAAGAQSAVMQRLAGELAQQAGLRVTAGPADLELRLRRPPGGASGWEALIRLSPRPLSARAWRVCNLEGALNATVAHAMALLTAPRPQDVFLNVACGSGTFLVERLAQGRAARAIGCDLSPRALTCARANLDAAGLTRQVELQPWDATALPLPDASVDALCADLPFGHLTGSHAANMALYPAVLREAARVARPGSRFALITHERRLATAALDDNPAWQVERWFPVALGQITPTVFLARRR